MTWLENVSGWMLLGLGLGYVAASSVLALAIARVLGRTSDRYELEPGSAGSDAAHEAFGAVRAAPQGAMDFEASTGADTAPGVDVDREECQGPGHSGTRLKPVVDEATTDVEPPRAAEGG